MHLRDPDHNFVCARFKLCLAEGYNDDMEACRLPAGLTPVRVISDYLRYLKDFTLNKLSIQWGSRSITAQDVMWALAIPAGWTDNAKQSMRQAAVCAGIVPHPSSRYVAIVKRIYMYITVMHVYYLHARSALRLHIGYMAPPIRLAIQLAAMPINIADHRISAIATIQVLFLNVTSSFSRLEICTSFLLQLDVVYTLCRKSAVMLPLCVLLTFYNL